MSETTKFVAANTIPASKEQGLAAEVSSLFTLAQNEIMAISPSDPIPTTTLVNTVTSPKSDLELTLDQNPAAIYLATLRPNGRRAMHYALNTMAHFISTGTWPTTSRSRSRGRGQTRPALTTADTELTTAANRQSPNVATAPVADAFSLPWHTLGYQHTSALAAALREHYKPATANLMLAALRGVLTHAENLGQMSADQYRRATKLKAVKQSGLPSGRALERAELEALLSVCAADPAPAGARDAAIIAVLYNAGLRRSEVVKLELRDYDNRDHSLRVRDGKGGKDRVTYIGEAAAQALGAWLTVRGQNLDRNGSKNTSASNTKSSNFSPTTNALFCPINKGHKVQSRHLTDQSILYILQVRAKAAGLQKSFSPHDFRRSFITDLLSAGADIATVQKLAGHSSVETTTRYDKRGEETKRQVAAMLELPYPSHSSSAATPASNQQTDNH